MYKILGKDKAGNMVVQLPDGKMAVYNKNYSMVNKKDSDMFLKKMGYKTKMKGKKLYVKKHKDMGMSLYYSPSNIIGYGGVGVSFKKQKGVINSTNLDDLAKF